MWEALPLGNNPWPTVELQLYQKLYLEKLLDYQNDFIQKYQMSYVKYEMTLGNTTSPHTIFSSDTTTSFLDMTCAEQQ
jgi:hypothetical protein